MRTATLPPIFPTFLLVPHFRLYEVVSLHVSVLPYKNRKKLEMVFELMKLCNTTGSRYPSADGGYPYQQYQMPSQPGQAPSGTNSHDSTGQDPWGQRNAAAYMGSAHRRASHMSAMGNAAYRRPSQGSANGQGVPIAANMQSAQPRAAVGHPISPAAWAGDGKAQDASGMNPQYYHM